MHKDISVINFEQSIGECIGCYAITSQYRVKLLEGVVVETWSRRGAEEGAPTSGVPRTCHVAVRCSREMRLLWRSNVPQSNEELGEQGKRWELEHDLDFPSGY